MDVCDARASPYVRAQDVEVDAARRRLEEDVERLAEQAPPARHDERHDREGGHRVGVPQAGRERDDRRDRDGAGAEEIRKDLEVRSPHREARALRVAEQRDRDRVARQTDRGHGEDDATRHLRGLRETPDALHEHDARDEEEQTRVQHGREDLEAQHPERPPLARRARREPYGHDRDRERDDVNKDVERLGEERQAARERGRDRFDDEDRRREHKRDDQARSRGRGRGMGVHCVFSKVQLTVEGALPPRWRAP